MPTHSAVTPLKPLSEVPHIFRFGEFQIDLAEGLLWRNGEKVALNRRTFNVLQLLVERAGEVVSKKEFFDTVWADTFVGDNSLTVAMATLRKVLEEDAKNPRFIENLPRKGYRFIGDVRLVSDPVEGPQNELEVVNARRQENGIGGLLQKRKGLVAVLGFSLLLLATFALGFTYVRSTPAGFEWNVGPSRIDSIAVMPFENRDTETEFLSDGLTESIISNLTSISNLRVISRNSVFSYKGKNPNFETIGRELNVRAILTGRVVQNGDKLIVSVELTDLRDNRQIWGQQYDRPAASAYAVQQDISLSIAQALRSRLSSEQRQRLVTHKTDDPEAYFLYLKGLYQLNKRTGEGYENAHSLFSQAIEKDHTYALAYVGQATCYAMGGFDYLPTTELRSSYTSAAVNKALEIDENLAEAYGVVGLNNAYYEWNWVAAEQNYRRAIELNPNYASAHHWYAEMLAIHGRFEESIAEYKRARALDPLSMAIATDLGITYHWAGQSDRAINYLQGLKKFNPEYPRIYIYLGDIYATQGMLAESIEEHDQYNALAEGIASSERTAALKEALAKSGPEGYWKKRLEIDEGSKANWIDLANVHLNVGNREKGLDLLEEYTSGRAASVVYIKAMPEFESIRSDPRFASILRRIGLPN